MATVGLVAAVQAARSSDVELHLYRPENLQEKFVYVGAALRTATEPDALVVTVEYDDGGANSAMLLYFAHRQGWSFDVRSMSAGLVPHLAARGARYFVTTNWRELEAQKPEVAARLLGCCKEIVLTDVPSGVRLFDLSAAGQ